MSGGTILRTDDERRRGAGDLDSHDQGGMTMTDQHAQTMAATFANHDAADRRRMLSDLEQLAGYVPESIGQTIESRTVTGWGGDVDQIETGGTPRPVWLTIEDTRDGVGRDVADVRAWVELGAWEVLREAARMILDGAESAPPRDALRMAGIDSTALTLRHTLERLTVDGIGRIRIDDDGRALVPLRLAMFPRAREPRAVSWRALGEISSHTFYQDGKSWTSHYAHLKGDMGQHLEVSDKARDAVQAELMAAVREHAPHVLESLTPADVVEMHAARVASSMAHDARRALGSGAYGVWKSVENGNRGSEKLDTPTDAAMRQRAVALMLEDDDVRAAVVAGLWARGISVGMPL